MFFCKVCSEPFHGFCLDEEPIDEDSWCCDSCSTCVVCGQQDKLLMCDKCQRGYHVDCLGPSYPVVPEGSEDTWICGRCAQCKLCGSKSAGEDPEAVWMHEFTHCYDCGTAWDNGNYCPICEKCYSDNDFDSKMMHCNDCQHWVHASCQNINPDEYECLSDLPDSIPFVCKLCCQEENPKWLQEMQEEMQAGYQRVIDEVESSRGYQPLIGYFSQVEFENGTPKDLDAVRAKVKENAYRVVGDFCHDMLLILNKVCKITGNQPLVRNAAVLYEVFIKEVGAMFPWHKIKSVQDSTTTETVKPEEDIKQDVVPAPVTLKPCNGVVGEPIDMMGWDHLYSAAPLLEQLQKQQDSQEKAFEQEQEQKLEQNQEKQENGNKKTDNKGNNEAEMDVDQHKEDPCSEEKLNSTIQVQTSEPTEAKNESPSQQPINGKDSPKQGNIKSSGVTVARKSNKRNSKIIPKKPVQEITNGDQVTDTRKCQLCNRLGDDEPTRAGRLLYSALDEWVHINCGLWSAEVFEDDEGRLQNVQAAVTRGKMMKCELCGEAGATVGCCENRCPMNYHFMCGRDAEAVYQDDKKVYCAQHSFRAKEDLVLKDKQFHVERRVCVDMSRVRTKGAGLKGAEPHAIQLMKGMLILV
ncbi:predicted protein, partial [Nematostella vectensis]